MLNEKLMEKLIEDFPCWKAKFTVKLFKNLIPFLLQISTQLVLAVWS